MKLKTFKINTNKYLNHDTINFCNEKVNQNHKVIATLFYLFFIKK